MSLDLSASVDGEEVEGGSANGLSYEVGSGDLVDGLDDAVTGKSAGETVTFTTTLRQGEKAGEQADVTATVNSVKGKELPNADDEFAQLASEFDTVDELRDDLRERLGRVKTLEQGSQARDKLLEQLIDTVEFPLPESAVNAEVDYREHDVVHSLGHDDALFDELLAAQGKTREEFTAELREAPRSRSAPSSSSTRSPTRSRSGRRRRADRVPRPAGRPLQHGAAGVRQPDRAGRQPADAGGRRAAQQGAARPCSSPPTSPTRPATRSTCPPSRPRARRTRRGPELADEPTSESAGRTGDAVRDLLSGALCRTTQPFWPFSAEGALRVRARRRHIASRPERKPPMRESAAQLVR